MQLERIFSPNSEELAHFLANYPFIRFREGNILLLYTVRENETINAVCPSNFTRAVGRKDRSLRSLLKDILMWIHLYAVGNYEVFLKYAEFWPMVEIQASGGVVYDIYAMEGFESEVMRMYNTDSERGLLPIKPYALVTITFNPFNIGTLFDKDLAQQIDYKIEIDNNLCTFNGEFLGED